MNHIYQEEQFGEKWFGYEELYKSFVDRLNDGSTIVEVGSWKGKSASYLAVEIINSKKNIKLYCVDTWKGSAEHQFDQIIIEDKLYELFLNNVKTLLNVITPIRQNSIEASKLFEDDSLDIVFINADHSYDAVKADIEAWYPKVKNKGILAGHDYGGWPDVTRAVDERFSNNIKTKAPSCWIHEVNK